MNVEVEPGQLWQLRDDCQLAYESKIIRNQESLMVLKIEMNEADPLDSLALILCPLGAINVFLADFFWFRPVET